MDTWVDRGKQIVKFPRWQPDFYCPPADLSRAGGTVASYFPSKDLGRFLSENFDLATIQSSFGPRRTPAKRTFADFGMKPSQVTEDMAVFLIPGEWQYELRVVARGDFNRDGIKDLKVCFTDRALNGGTYDAALA